jgi:hypothetical protein
MRWPTPALALCTVVTLTGLICCLIIKEEPAILKATTSVVLLAALFPAPQIRTTRRILVWVIFSTGHICVRLLDRAKYLLAAGCTDLVLGIFAAVVTWQYWKEARESDLSLRTGIEDGKVNASAKEKD